MMIPPSRIVTKEQSYPIRIAILGSTGSIGTAALAVLASHPDVFELVGIAAGQNETKLIEQVARFKPRYAVLANHSGQKPEFSVPVNFEVGVQAVSDLATHADVDIVLAAISGSAGLASTIAALKAGKTVALANKESLICAGAYIQPLLEAYGGSIIPVDSEHSALFQALQGERFNDVDRLILTASGGPFLHTPKNAFDSITPQQALKHPRWEMGAKITVDSATLMNKALEFIEAYWLFGIEPDKIDVVIHPESIVHSAVLYKDGSQLAQLSQPDMKGPIAYALHFPYGRLDRIMKPLSLTQLGQLTFLELDNQKFESIQMARDCIQSGEMAPVIFNIANEIAVEQFLSGQMRFSGIYAFVQECLNRYVLKAPQTIEALLETVEELQVQLRAEITNSKVERAV